MAKETPVDVDREALAERLDAGLEQLGLELAAEARDRLIGFVALLMRWNRAFNLTAVRDPSDAVTRHLLDSLSIVDHVVGPRVLDVGTGAGLPGIPLAIARPDARFALLDCNGKKIRFVRQAIAELGIPNAEVVQSRIEDHRAEAGYTTAVSRATASLADLEAATGRLIARPGRLIVMKGKMPRDELDALVLPEGVGLEIHRLSVPMLDAERHLIEMTYR